MTPFSKCIPYTTHAYPGSDYRDFQHDSICILPPPRSYGRAIKLSICKTRVVNRAQFCTSAAAYSQAQTHNGFLVTTINPVLSTKFHQFTTTSNQHVTFRAAYSSYCCFAKFTHQVNRSRHLSHVRPIECHDIAGPIVTGIHTT